MNSSPIPTLLAGPIIRRVEPTQVFIWMATTKPYRIYGELYNISENEEYQFLPSKGKANTIRLGKNLYIHLLRMTPNNERFPIDQLLGYNLIFKHRKASFDLEDLGLLTPDHPETIVYGHLKYPTFYINGSIEECNLLYGSCRKLHGEGKDALASADHILKDTHKNITKRPQSLFLMGDQIYADDVPDPMILIISKMAHLLMGQREKLEEIDNRLDQKSLNNSIQQVNGRQYIMKHLCNFTSSSSDNHLLTFGEYAAMYLFSWSPVLWEFAKELQLFKSFQSALEKGHIYFNFPSGKENVARKHETEKAQLQDRYQKQEEMLKTFQHSLYQVRRILANTPTYMIFSDHDITDDWNINSKWKENAESSPLGKHVITNGLAAYWAFQGWGNHPEAFDQNFLSTIKKYFRSLMKGNIHSYRDDCSKLLLKFDEWHFIAPTTPTAVFLDTRTQRKYELVPKPIKLGKMIMEIAHPPQLVNDTAWENITRLLLKSGWAKNRPLIVVTASPVYGMGLIETFLHDYVYPLRAMEIQIQTIIDFEAWRYNLRGFTNFLKHVSNWSPNTCIILSGDAHFSSAVNAKVQFPNDDHLSIKQFTSSPLKNMSFNSMGGTLLKWAIHLYASKYKKKDISRYCDSSYHIHSINKGEIAPSSSSIWTDQLRYHPINKNEDQIIETRNNLGLLSLSPKFIENHLLTRDQ